MTAVAVVAWPLFVAAIMLATFRNARYRKSAGLAGSAVHLFLAILLFLDVYRLGTVRVGLSGWPAPFGIEFAADLFGAILTLLTGFIGLLVMVFSLENIDSERRQYGFTPLFFVLIAGLSGAFLTNDLFNLFVWFECILLSSFVLLSLGGEKPQIRGAINYVVPNLFASVIFLSATGLIYGLTGTLNMDDIGQKIAQNPDHPLLPPIAILFLVAFSVKGALFPFYTWLPNSYHTPPVTVTALFAGLLTKVGVYSIYRFFTKVYPLPEGPLVHFLIWISVLTMLGGILGAIVQTDIRRILAFHSISQLGYMTVGLALRDPIAIAASIFYMVHHTLVKTNLFLFSGVLQWHYNTTERGLINGALRRQPLLAAAMFVPMMALAGLPPFLGFWPKYGLVQAAVAHQNWLLTGVMLFTGLFTLYSMAKIWSESFWKEPKDPAQEAPLVRAACPPSKFGPAIVLCACVASIGLAPSVVTAVADRAAKQLAPNWSTPLQINTETPTGGNR